MCSWPRKSSSVRGRIRAASGAAFAAVSVASSVNQSFTEQKYGAGEALHIIFRAMRKAALLFPLLLISCFCALGTPRLPMAVTFKGRDRFDRLVALARENNWASLPIGARTATVGEAIAAMGTPYKSFTLEIDNRIESPSVNLAGQDCWTFFENALAFARMLNEPQENWTPETMLRYIELDRYRGGECTGAYLSRLHYLEDWLYDNDRRGLVRDLTHSLGGVNVPHSAREMTLGWQHYRYLKANTALLAPLRQMEEGVSNRPLVMIPKSRVPAAEARMQSGDIIGIISRDGPRLFSTSHVGLALRTSDGVLHFMHASAPHNYGRVVVDSRLIDYLNRYRTDAGILVARPLK
jgi:hypothetical protein